MEEGGELMPAIQTTYLATHAQAFEGMVANSEPCVVISRTVEDVEGIGFGKVAVQGDRDDTITDAEASKAFRGITVMDPATISVTVDKYDRYATVPVMTKGVIWVQASVAVSVGQPVYFVPATGVLTNVSTSNTLIPNAIWDSSTSGAALAKVRLA
jgi:hypothetical protein